MQDSRSSSEQHGRGFLARRVAFALGLAFALGATTGCATVRPEEKEFLSEPSMTWNNGSIADAQEQHVLDNREGSSGGANAKGGGCGCN